MTGATRVEILTAALPLRFRRRVLRASWRARLLTGSRATFGLCPVFEATLRVPRAEARRLDVEAAFSDALFGLEWLALLDRGRERIIADWQTVQVPDRSLIERVAASDKPVILAPIHMGCFALTFAMLIHEIFRGRRMLILRAREDREVETRVMRRISEAGVEMRFLNVNHKQDYIDAIRFARTGSVIVSFLDLPASYGGAVETTLFGRPVKLAMGIDTLARITGATVVPLAITSGVDGDVVHLSRPFEVADSGPSTKARVTEIVRHHIEEAVMRAPQQWLMWPRFGEFLQDGTEGGSVA